MTNQQVNQVPTKDLKRGFSLSIVFGILLGILGFIAIARPFFAGIATNFYLGWVIALGGFTQTIYAIQTRKEGQFLWKLLIGILYIFAGCVLLLYPLEGLFSLTLILGISILGSGLSQIFLALIWKPENAWTWILFRGIFAMLLGIWILADWPSDSPWLIGTLVGISLISDGIGITTLSAVARNTIGNLQSTPTQ